MAKKHMTLREYIRSIGKQEFMSRYGFGRRATDSYAEGWRRPRPEDPRTLDLLKRSPVTFEGIYHS